MKGKPLILICLRPLSSLHTCTVYIGLVRNQRILIQATLYFWAQKALMRPTERKCQLYLRLQPLGTQYSYTPRTGHGLGVPWVRNLAESLNKIRTTCSSNVTLKIVDLC